jgi:hypothetical protein
MITTLDYTIITIYSAGLIQVSYGLGYLPAFFAVD